MIFGATLPSLSREATRSSDTPKRAAMPLIVAPFFCSSTNAST